MSELNKKSSQEQLSTTERLPYFARQHSRSSSQVATLASLATLSSLNLTNTTTSTTLSPNTSSPPSPTRSQTGNQSPRFSISGLTGSGNFINGNFNNGTEGIVGGGGIESPIYLSRSNTPEPPIPLQDRYGRLSLDSSTLTSNNNNIRNNSRISSTSSSSNNNNEQSLSNSNPSLSTSNKIPELTPIETSTTSLAQLIQQKRRQNSAPYFAAARSSSLFSPGAGFGISSINGNGNGNGMATERIDYAGAWGGGASRARSRQATRAGSLALNDEGGMVMTPTTAEWRQLGGKLTEIADIRARDEEKIEANLPNPITTDSNTIRSPIIHKSNHSSGANSFSTNSSSSSSIELNELGKSANIIMTSIDLPSVSPISPISPIRPSPRPIEVNSDLNLLLSSTSTSAAANSTKFRSTSFSYQSSKSGFTHSSSLSFDLKKTSNIPSTPPPPTSSSSTFIPSHRLLSSSDSTRPNLSRGSLSTTTVGTPTPLPGTPLSSYQPYSSSSTTSTPLQESSSLPISLSPSYQSSQPPFSKNLSTALNEIEIETIKILLPVNLNWISFEGKIPVDPKRYSAFTGLRGIENFVVRGEAGKGAYGTVCKAREKGEDGQAIGPELVIKYIIKQRILADCWKKHKILGPIPIEVHVLDHLRRVPYSPRIIGRSKNLIGGGGRRDSSLSLRDGGGGDVKTGHPNICGMLDFFEDGEFYYLVMPQAGTDPEAPTAPRGQDLFEHVDANPDGLPSSSIRKILSQIADALSFLHQHGIVHRDIKDENVVLDHLGNAQLIDFGSAAYVKEGKKFDTFSGTLDFAAPEVLRGARYGGKETDVWALGVLGYVITIGECPFWSPEEAMQGLYPGSRAERALKSKCPSSSTTTTTTLPPPSSSSNFTTFTQPIINDEYNRMGSGKIEDAVDLVMRCLEVDPFNRPTADQILEHRFILGTEGWSGIRGWEIDFDDDDDEVVKMVVD